MSGFIRFILTLIIGVKARFLHDCVDVGDAEGGNQTGGEGNYWHFGKHLQSDKGGGKEKQ